MSYIIEKKDEAGNTYLRLNQRTKRGTYRILPNSSQYKYCEKIVLEGFSKLPTGFYTKGGIGLTGAGNFFLGEIYDKYKKKIELKIIPSGTSKMNSRGGKVKITIPHRALSRINSEVRATKKIRNEEVRTQVRQFLSIEFKRQFRMYRDVSPQYSSGSLAQILGRDNIISRLGIEDREKLEEFIPEYFDNIKGTLRAKQKLQIIFDALDAGKKVYFKKVVNEFRLKLKRNVQNEGVWQSFLSEYILILRNTYGEVLEKESISLSGKFPDFMLLDPYNYLDIYEIKKPTTKLLKLDKSRNNYYWDVEMVKAISQVENYLYQVQRNSDTLITDIRKSKSIDINIVRPKGYIVAGTRNQLKNTKMLDDFRILTESLKNVDIILYDDLLQNLESFVEKIGK